MIKTILKKLGFLSPCCGARYIYVFGWDYKEDDYKCSKCLK